MIMYLKSFTESFYVYYHCNVSSKVSDGSQPFRSFERCLVLQPVIDVRIFCPIGFNFFKVVNAQIFSTKYSPSFISGCINATYDTNFSRHDLVIKYMVPPSGKRDSHFKYNTKQVGYKSTPTNNWPQAPPGKC
jgi:hypothetical protein